MTAEETVFLACVRDLVASGEARTRRVQAGLSLSDVARAVQVAPTTIWRWEGGRRSPRGQAALRYGHLLDSLIATGAVR
jgi:transcriptional regulator with XRE-family HTH domain